MPAKDETRWTQNKEGAWTRRVGGNEETTYVNPNATDSAVAAAEELGVDLSSVAGSGAGGRITKGDVANAAKEEEEDDS
jgi:pyruvate/2-oxoglutarate dehydrogenase complex dihydrolipoamide acyltransferase (E2) component